MRCHVTQNALECTELDYGMVRNNFVVFPALVRGDPQM
jgi:hypothetical protein